MKILFLDIDGVLNHRGVFRVGNPAPIDDDAWFRIVEANIDALDMETAA